MNPALTSLVQQRTPGYVVRGGPTFVGVNGAADYPYKRDNNMIQPRVGFAYMLDDKTIMRGGYGIYYLNVVGISASDGFGDADAAGDVARRRSHADLARWAIRSRTASWTRRARRSACRRTSGRTLGFSNNDFVNPYVHQFSYGFQRMLPWRMTFEASYVGSRTRALQNRWAGFNEPSVDAARSVRSVEGRQSRASATSCCRIRSSRCRASRARRGSRARRCRATN